MKDTANGVQPVTWPAMKSDTGEGLIITELKIVVSLHPAADETMRETAYDPALV